MRDLRSETTLHLRPAQETVRKQILLLGVEEATLCEPPINRTQPPVVSSGLRVRGAGLPMWRRQVRMDNGWGLLPQMWAPRTLVLIRAVDPT